MIYTSRFYLLLILSLWIMIGVGCKKDSKIKREYSKISFLVDSLKVYDIKQFYADLFIFSPAESTDKIWLVNNSTIIELDLKTGVSTSISTKLNKVCGRVSFNANKIWRDQVTNNVLIADFHCGLINYDRKTDSISIINIRLVNEVYPGNNHVVIGSWNGLYTQDRKTGIISIVKQFPLDEKVNSISKWREDTLLINNQYLYDLNSGSVTESFRIKAGYENQLGNQRASIVIQSILPGYGENYKVIADKTCAFYFRTNALYFSSDYHNFFKFNGFPNGVVRLVLQDDFNLYILYNEKFVILSKKFIIEHGIEFNTQEFQNLQKELNEATTFLWENDNSLSKYINTIQKFKNDRRFDKYTDLSELIGKLSQRLKYKSENPAIRYQMIQAIKIGLLKNDILFYSLKDLARYYTAKANLDSAMLFFKKLEAEFADSSDNCINKMSSCVGRIKKSLDSINVLIIPKDEYLYNEIKLRDSLIRCGCWFGDTYLNWRLVEEKYIELLNTFPKSKYAEDAEFWLLTHGIKNDYEEYLPEDIPKFKKFILKYPNSTRIPEIIRNIASSYVTNNEENIDSIANNYNRAISELEYYYRFYRLDSLEKREISDLISRYNKNLNSSIFEVSLIARKSVFERNEDIDIIVKVENKCSLPKSIYLMADSSLFNFYIHSDQKVSFTPYKDVDTSNIKIIIKASDTFIQTISLNKKARYPNSDKLGKFEITEKGLYELSGYSKLNSLETPRIKFYFNN